MSDKLSSIDNITAREKATIKADAKARDIKLTEARSDFLQTNRDDFWLRQSIFGTYTPTSATVDKLRADNGYSFDTDIADRRITLDLGTAPLMGIGAENTQQALAKAIASSVGASTRDENTDAALAALRGVEVTDDNFGGFANHLVPERARDLLSGRNDGWTRGHAIFFAGRYPVRLTLGSDVGDLGRLRILGDAASGKTALLTAIHLGLRARYSADQVTVSRFSVARRRTRPTPAAVDRDFRALRGLSGDDLLERVRTVTEKRASMSDDELNSNPVVVFLVDFSQAELSEASRINDAVEEISASWELGFRYIEVKRRGVGDIELSKDPVARWVTSCTLPEQVGQENAHRFDGSVLVGCTAHQSHVITKPATTGFDQFGPVNSDSPLWDLVAGDDR